MERLCKCKISIGKISDIIDAILDRNKSIESQTKSKSCILCSIYVRMSQNIGMEHTSTKQFYPPYILTQSTTFSITGDTACIYFKSRFYKREIGWSHSNFHIFFKNSAQKINKKFFAVCNTHIFINNNSFELSKHTIMTRIHVFIPIDLTRNHNLAWDSILLDQLVVHTCCMSPEHKIFSSLITILEKKCIMHFSCWMTCRNI